MSRSSSTSILNGMRSSALVLVAPCSYSGESDRRRVPALQGRRYRGGTAHPVEARSGLGTTPGPANRQGPCRVREATHGLASLQQALDAAGVDTLIGHLRNFGGHHLFRVTQELLSWWEGDYFSRRSEPMDWTEMSRRRRTRRFNRFCGLRCAFRIGLNPRRAVLVRRGSDSGGTPGNKELRAKAPRACGDDVADARNFRRRRAPRSRLPGGAA